MTPAPADVKFVSLAGGHLHNLALAQNGDVDAWGNNAERQLGDALVRPFTLQETAAGITDPDQREPRSGLTPSTPTSALPSCSRRSRRRGRSAPRS